MAEFTLKFHGTGNAWPVMLGDEHPFYDRHNCRDLSNAAFSLLLKEGAEVRYEVLIDAGHGTIQSLLSSTNRIPEAICLTHGHLDHTLSVDWVVQSFYRQHQKKRRYPVYCTRLVFETLVASYPHLEPMITFYELLFGVTRRVGGTDLRVTAFPVYHGPHARGASMLLFQREDLKVMMTGDLLTPLLREQDFSLLEGVAWLISDSNNRFPYPGSNHWSIVGATSDTGEDKLSAFTRTMDADLLTAPHIKAGSFGNNNGYFSEWLHGFDLYRQHLCLADFHQRINPRNTALVHYSGTEDERYYGEPRLTREALKAWAGGYVTVAEPVKACVVPAAGDEVPVEGN